MKKFSMTRIEAEAHQRRHGFLPPLGLGKGETKPVAGRTATRRPRMNKTETEFSFFLEARRRKGEIDGWRYEPVRLRLADGAWYKPDFMSWTHDIEELPSVAVVVFYEVKGAHIREAAMVRFKVAREQFPWASFEMWQKKQGQWNQIA
jgi:hypothetical protein